MSLEIGSWVWISDEEECVIPGQVIELTPGKSGKFKLEDGTEKILDGQGLVGLEKLDPQCLDKNVSNLIGLSNLSENAILHNLRIRFKNDDIYTFVSSILIAVNPFRQLPIYGVETLEKYRSTSDKSTLPPHIFTIADNAFKAMMSDNTPQSVVISGESGAGKTESAKMVLNYLVSRASNNLDGSTESTENVSSIERRLIESSPVLEAFGNAKTGRNANSSRFGKYLKIFFLPKSQNTSSDLQTRQIAGAAIETYLLEKSRVVGHAPNERNYHIFYQLLAAKGANLPSLSNCPLTSSSSGDYQILGSVEDIAANRKTSTASSTTINRQGSHGGENTAESFMEVENAFRILQMSNEKIQSIWNTLAAILEIGNIIFIDQETPQGTVSKIENINQAQLSASLLGVTTESLEATLTKRVMTARGESYTISLNSKDALNARNAICKALYSAIFTTLVNIINDALTGNIPNGLHSQLNSIGVLDIFGFESFPHNEFEQLLINYANEELQSAFNRHVFQNELRLYQEENISSDLTIDQCPNNSGCVTLLAGPKISVLATLQSSSQMANASDELFFENVNKSFESINDLELKKFYVKAHPKDKKSMFTIKHFAGKVSYHAGPKGLNTWLLKNNDDIPQDLSTMLQTSNIETIQSFVYLTLPPQATTPAGNGRRSSLRKQSIADGFIQSMTSLVKTLNETTCSFIRCIKPNPELKPITFNNSYTLEQIRALGLVQVCSVMKIGLPTRISFAELKEALGPVAKEAEVLFHGLPEETFIASLLYAFDIPKDVYQLGRTKLFFKSGQLDALDRILSTDFVEKKDEIMERLNIALKARNDCEEAVKTLTASCNEVSEIYKIAQQDVIKLSTTLIDLKEKTFKEFNKEYKDISHSTEKILSVLNSSNISISDVVIYGKDVEKHENFTPIQKLINDALETLSLSEQQWKKLDLHLLEVETFCTDPGGQMYELCTERSDEIPRYEAEIAEVYELMNTVVLEANRCNIQKVNEKSADIEHELSLIKYHLKKHSAGIQEIEKLKSDALKKMEDLKLYLIDIKKFIHNSVTIGHTINDLCQNIRNKIDELRAQIAKDLEEKRRMEEEARRREEEEKKRREEEERQYYAELERQRLEAEHAAKLAAAEEEAKRILKEQLKQSQKSLPKIVSNRVLAAYDSDEELDADTVSELTNQLYQNYDQLDDLPEGWEKHIDATKNIPYYVNTVTQTSQWSRPSSPAGNIHDDDKHEDVKVISDERRLFDSLSLMSNDGSDLTSLTDEHSHGISRRGQLEQADRQASFVSIDGDNDNNNSNNNNDIDNEDKKISSTINIEDVKPELSSEKVLQSEPEPELDPVLRKGILQKQGGLFGMWSKKFFVLEDEILSYYESSQGYLTGANASKQIIITSSTELSYTKMSHCFKVKSDGHEWVLMSENKELMREWINDIRTIITRLYDARIKFVMQQNKK